MREVTGAVEKCLRRLDSLLAKVCGPMNVDELIDRQRVETERAALAMLNPWHIRRLTGWERTVRY